MAIHDQTTFKQRYFNVHNVYTTLFQRRLTMMWPLGIAFGAPSSLSLLNIEYLVVIPSATSFLFIIYIIYSRLFVIQIQGNGN